MNRRSFLKQFGLMIVMASPVARWLYKKFKPTGVGYIGRSYLETGYVYAPYVPLQINPDFYKRIPITLA